MEKNYRVDANFRWLGSELKETQELCLTVCGIEKCLPDKSFGPAIRNDYHVHVILKGKGYFVVNDRTYTLTRGQIFVVFPDIETYYYADPDDPWHYTWVSFGGTKASFYLEKSGITAAHPVRDTFAEPERYLAFTEGILNYHTLTASSELARMAYLYEFLQLLSSSYTEHLAASHQKFTLDYSSDVYFQAAKKYIEDHAANVKIAEVADYIGISRYYLSHLFSDKLKMSPKEYLMNCRMEQAVHALRFTSSSINDIALSCGYENPLIFSKAFKKRFGMSPRSYRKAFIASTDID